MAINVHKSITIKRVTQAIKQRYTSLDNPGICLACGEDQDGCEPDAERYECEGCGESQVYGAEQIFMIGAYHFPEHEDD